MAVFFTSWKIFWQNRASALRSGKHRYRLPAGARYLCAYPVQTALRAFACPYFLNNIKILQALRSSRRLFTAVVPLLDKALLWSCVVRSSSSFEKLHWSSIKTWTADVGSSVVVGGNQPVAIIIRRIYGSIGRRLLTSNLEHLHPMQQSARLHTMTFVFVSIGTIATR